MEQPVGMTSAASTRSRAGPACRRPACHHERSGPGRTRRSRQGGARPAVHRAAGPDRGAEHRRGPDGPASPSRWPPAPRPSSASGRVRTSWWSTSTPAPCCSRTTALRPWRGDRDDRAGEASARGTTRAVQVGLGSLAASKWTTMSTPSTWMPRAATSVATTAWTSPLLNFCRFRSRTRWLRSPCRSTAPALAASASARVHGGVAGAGEHDGAAVGAHQVGRRRDLLLESADHQRVVGHRRHRLLVGVELVAAGVAQVGLDQRVDVAVERGATAASAGSLRGHADQLVDRRVEAEVAQVVGLVENRDLDVVEEACSPARAGHRAGPASRRRCRPATELPGLGFVRRTAVDRDHLEAHGAGQRLDRPATWLASSRVGTMMTARGWHGRVLPAGQASEHRQAERERLAGAGPSATQDVVAAHGVGDDRRLDRRRLGDALLGEGRAQDGGERGEDRVRSSPVVGLGDGLDGGRAHASQSLLWVPGGGAVHLRASPRCGSGEPCQTRSLTLESRGSPGLGRAIRAARHTGVKKSDARSAAGCLQGTAAGHRGTNREAVRAMSAASPRTEAPTPRLFVNALDSLPAPAYRGLCQGN